MLLPFFRASSRKAKFSAKLPWKENQIQIYWMILLNQRENVSTYENFVANDVLQLELPRYCFKRYAVVCLQEPCRQEMRPEMQELSG